MWHSDPVLACVYVFACTQAEKKCPSVLLLVPKIQTAEKSEVHVSVSSLGTDSLPDRLFCSDERLAVHFLITLRSEIHTRLFTRRAVVFARQPLWICNWHCWSCSASHWRTHNVLSFFLPFSNSLSLSVFVIGSLSQNCDWKIKRQNNANTTLLWLGLLWLKSTN